MYYKLCNKLFLGFGEKSLCRKKKISAQTVYFFSGIFAPMPFSHESMNLNTGFSAYLFHRFGNFAESKHG